MAKDGTSRGGVRVGAGKKRKALADKILDGQIDGEILPAVAEFEDIEDMPKPREYLTDEQKGGENLLSPEIYKDTWKWLKKYGCQDIIPKNLLEQYSQISGRYIYCEKLLSKYGLLSKHPTTDAPIASPFVTMSINYLKQAQTLWYQIFQLVKENSVLGVTDKGINDTMESLLRRVK